MKENYDAIVIGGGLGGLLAGGLLAKNGLETLIVEKNPFLGGRCRTIEWGGFRADIGPKVQTAFYKDSKDTWFYRACEMLGVHMDMAIVDWHIVSVNKKGVDKPTFDPFDPRLGSQAFIDFFAIMTGAKFNEVQRTELKRVLEEMGTVSEETCKEFLNTAFTDWSRKNVGDAVVRTFFQGTTILAGVDVSVYPTGHMIGAMGAINKGTFNFGYPIGQVLMDSTIGPLEKACKGYGCDIVTNMDVRRICTENKKANGAWLRDRKTDMLYKASAPVVVCAVPLYTALGTILEDEDFTESERRFIEMTVKGKQDDYIGFYFLKEEVIPPNFPAWTHIFDFTTGGPVYRGDVYIPLGAHPQIGATGPKGKQLLLTYMIGGPEGPFDEDFPDYERVRKEEREFEDLVEIALPGFKNAIEHQGHVLSENWGRFCYLMHDPNDTVEVKSKAVKGLYFAGDTPFVLGSLLGLEKCGRVGIECSDTILRDLGKK